MNFDWHEAKSDLNRRERGFDFTYAARIFDGDVVEYVDERGEYGEVRVIAFGHIDELRYAVVYTLREDVRWIVSAFRCREKELRRWERRAKASL